MNSYETLFVVDATLSEEEVKATIEKFTALIAENGTIDSVDEWGKRKLAYPINDKNDGYYVLVNFKSEGEFPSELERLFGINEYILRSIVIRHIEDKKTVKEA
ncbi:MAG: 30S ribosomal protein S6 [Clostridia bacterium]|nr:30S ribosomal protein S6 [Clostridia bacterium]